MIIRIVKLTFKREFTEDFKKFSLNIKDDILKHEGCLHLEILRDTNNPNIFFTYSHWESEVFLDKYRKTDFFVNVWSSAKKWFADKPQAWSVEKQ